jgi:hypothetical protein
MSTAASLAGWAVAVPLIVALTWFSWWIWNANNKLDARIITGDLDLLSSPSFSISEIIRAPMGSRVDVAQVVAVQQLPPNMMMVPVRLPDGSVGMMPVRTAAAPVSMQPLLQPPLQ